MWDQAGSICYCTHCLSSRCLPSYYCVKRQVEITGEEHYSHAVYVLSLSHLECPVLVWTKQE